MNFFIGVIKFIVYLIPGIRRHKVYDKYGPIMFQLRQTRMVLVTCNNISALIRLAAFDFRTYPVRLRPFFCGVLFKLLLCFFHLLLFCQVFFPLLQLLLCTRSF